MGIRNHSSHDEHRDRQCPLHQPPRSVIPPVDGSWIPGRQLDPPGCPASPIPPVGRASGVFHHRRRRVKGVLAVRSKARNGPSTPIAGTSPTAGSSYRRLSPATPGSRDHAHKRTTRFGKLVIWKCRGCATVLAPSTDHLPWMHHLRPPRAGRFDRRGRDRLLPVVEGAPIRYAVHRARRSWPSSNSTRDPGCIPGSTVTFRCSPTVPCECRFDPYSQASVLRASNSYATDDNSVPLRREGPCSRGCVHGVRAAAESDCTPSRTKDDPPSVKKSIL